MAETMRGGDSTSHLTNFRCPRGNGQLKWLLGRISDPNATYGRCMAGCVKRNGFKPLPSASFFRCSPKFEPNDYNRFMFGPVLTAQTGPQCGGSTNHSVFHKHLCCARARDLISHVLHDKSKSRRVHSWVRCGAAASA